MPASTQKVSDAELQERHETVDTLDIIGVKPSRIFKQLGAKHYENRGYADSFETFWHDLKAVRAGRKGLLLDGRKDLALQELVARLKDVYSRALIDKSYGHAINALLHIARARGLDLTTPTGLKGRLTVEKFHDTRDQLSPEQTNRINEFLGGLSDMLDDRPALPESTDNEP